MDYIELFGRTRNMPFKPLPDKYAESSFRNMILYTEGASITMASYPAKFLPVVFKDISTDDPIVITKGTIVGVLGPFSTGGIPVPADNGTIPVYTDAVTGDIVSLSLDDSFWGYPDSVCGLLFPATDDTGSDVTYTYTYLDEEFGIYKADKTAAKAGDSFTVSNIRPVGVVISDVYADLRGKYLNYTPTYNNITRVVVNGYIGIPFVNVTDFDSNFTTPFINGTSGVYFELAPLFSFLYGAKTDLLCGKQVMSDMYGKFKIFDPGTNYSDWKVGRICELDTRFPKSMAQHADSYPESYVTGTDTMGIPSFLYGFASVAMYISNGTEPSRQDVYNAIRSGIFGIAKIYIDL